MWYNVVMIPQPVATALWSYDVSAMDLVRDKVRIITNVLNYGTAEAIDWLFATYPREEIIEVAKHPRPGEWNKKSINFWSVVFGISPVERSKIA
jgi:hypothetical protein